MVLNTVALNNKLKEHKNVRFHISNEAINLQDIKNVDQPIIEYFNCSGRPNGLYYSFGNSWLNFLLQKKTSTAYKPCCYLYKVEINDNNKILHFPNHESVIDFHKKTDKYYLNTRNFNLCNVWNFNPTKIVPYGDMINGNYKNLFDFYKSKKIIYDNKEEYVAEMNKYYIDFSVQNELVRWDKISQHYYGVEFNNYHKSRNTPKWYNSLDVSSGCIWNTKALYDLQLLATVVEYDDDKQTNNWVLTDEGKALLM